MENYREKYENKKIVHNMLGIDCLGIWGFCCILHVTMQHIKDRARFINWVWEDDTVQCMLDVFEE